MAVLVVIGGPTAVGKTATSMAVAQYFQTEIVSADSRQFYKEMSIGTAKPSISELQKVPHHFVDFLHVWEPYNAGDFEKDALAKLNILFQRYPVVLMTGGSGLYINAVCNGFDEMPEISMDIRDKLNLELDQKGIEFLQERLEEADPAYYNMVDLNNPQRLIRALEVYEATGKPYSSFRNTESKRRPFKIIYIGLDMPRQDLYDRINKRVDQMIEEGLVEEVKSLIPYENMNALQTVGYQELLLYLKSEISLQDAIDQIKQNTRRYAKRQLTWFRKNPETQWYHPDDITGIIHYISSHLEK